MTEKLVFLLAETKILSHFFTKIILDFELSFRYETINYFSTSWNFFFETETASS